MSKPFEIPKYILVALDRRRKAALAFQTQDYIVSTYCQKHEIDTEFIYSHAECIVEPDGAYEHTLTDIRKHFNRKD